jgi:hypothetical protein
MNKWKIKRIPSKIDVISTSCTKVSETEAEIRKEIQHTYTSKLCTFKNLGEFHFITPEPVDLLIQHIELKINLMNKLIKDFNDLPQGDDKILTPERETVFEDIILNSISIPVMIICTIETFVNQIIFENSPIIGSSFEVQRYVPLDKKLFKILPELTFRTDLYLNNSFKSSYNKVIGIRNNIIHQKRNTKEGEEVLSLITELIETDWEAILNDLKELMKKSNII